MGVFWLDAPAQAIEPDDLQGVRGGGDRQGRQEPPEQRWPAVRRDDFADYGKMEGRLLDVGAGAPVLGLAIVTGPNETATRATQTTKSADRHRANRSPKRPLTGRRDTLKHTTPLNRIIRVNAVAPGGEGQAEKALVANLSSKPWRGGEGTNPDHGLARIPIVGGRQPDRRKKTSHGDELLQFGRIIR